jgi:radical SAM protein with 4Fe4S-binding SPASM domain
LSIDTLLRDRYTRIRGVDTFDRVVHNIRRFAEVRREHGRRLRGGRWMPSAEIRMVCMDDNVEELPNMLRFAAEAGIERVTSTFMLEKKHSTSQSELAAQRTESLRSSGLGEIERKVAAESQRLGVRFTKMPYTEDILNTCEWPWRMPYITYDGYVTSCCHIENPEVGHFGNIFEQSFEQIWNGPTYREFRRCFTDLSKNKTCRLCPFLTEEQTAPYVDVVPKREIVGNVG